MNCYRPITDLKDDFDDIMNAVYETNQPIFLTKENKVGMIVLSMEAFENLQFESEVYCKLQEAEKEAELTDKRYSSKEVFKAMKDVINS